MAPGLNTKNLKGPQRAEVKYEAVQLGKYVIMSAWLQIL